MQNSFVLFICRANVGRSQIAEGFYRKYHDDNVISIAGAEAKKEKYHGRPLSAIVDFLHDHYTLDISSQKISYLWDIPLYTLRSIRSVYFLYDPVIEMDCDAACMREGMSPYYYFQKQSIDITIVPVDDPFDEWPSWYQSIIEKISVLVASL